MTEPPFNAAYKAMMRRVDTVYRGAGFTPSDATRIRTATVATAEAECDRVCKLWRAGQVPESDAYAAMKAVEQAWLIEIAKARRQLAARRSA